MEEASYPYSAIVLDNPIVQLITLNAAQNICVMVMANNSNHRVPSDGIPVKY